jgi:hypothetical protein
MLLLLLTVTTAISTLAGGWIAVRERRRVHVLLGFGAGVLLGASFFDLLPEALMAAAKQGWNSRATLALPVVGFLLFYGADRFLETHICPTGDCEAEARRRIGRMSAVGLIAHSALDGASIAAATLASWRLCVRLGTALCGRGLNNRQNDLHESAWIGIAYSKFSTKFFGAHSHSAQTDSDTGGVQFCDVLLDACSVILYRNDHFAFPKPQGHPCRGSCRMSENVG